MGHKLLCAALVIPLLVFGCGRSSLTGVEEEGELGVLSAQRVVGDYLVEFQTNAGQQQAGVTASVQFRVLVAEPGTDDEATPSWRLVTGLAAEIYCLEAGGFEETHRELGAGDGTYEAVHTFSAGETYAALRFPGVDGATVEAGFWVNLPLAR